MAVGRFETVVREVVRETADAVTLVLDPGQEVAYRAGQFLSIDPHALEATRERAREVEERKGRKERPRAYSLASAPHEAHLAITVKAEEEGAYPSVLSPWLVDGARPGDRIPVTGFSGLYTIPDELPAGAHVVHLCAGSGIVPNWSMIKDALHRELPYPQTLVFSNRKWSDVLFARPLTELAAKKRDRLEVVHALTRECTAPDGVRVVPRRIDAELLRELIPDLGNAWFFVCGPSVPTWERQAARARGEKPAPRFLECLKSVLTDELGIDRRRVWSEGW